MTSWQTVFHKGIVPCLSTAGLKALRRALATDDSRLMQEGTTSPPPLQCVLDWPVEAACAVGYCGWVGDGLETVAEVEEFFAKICFDCDQLLQEPAGCRWFLNWFDETPRDVVLRELLPEVKLALSARAREEEASAGRQGLREGA